MKDYKKILEGVVDIINTTEKSDIGFANICTYIGENCPELAESEDEKIRKKIIKLVKEHSVNHERCQMETWLEKQRQTFTKKDIDDAYLKGVCDAKHELEKHGEQKPVDKIQLGKKYKCIASPRYTTFVKGSIHKPDDKFLCSLMNFCSDCFVPIEDGEQKQILDVEIPFGAKDSELEEVSYSIPNGYHAEIEDNKVIIKKGEQKPTSWSEYDESMLNFVKVVLNKHKNDEFFDKFKTTLSDCLSWFRDIKSRVGCEVSCTTKQEWSEEDIIAIDCAVEVLSKDLPSLAASIERLKSLRPQSTWKPSDEKMEYLAKAITTLGDEGDFETALILNNLRFELKKLMEE